MHSLDWTSKGGKEEKKFKRKEKKYCRYSCLLFPGVRSRGKSLTGGGGGGGKEKHTARSALKSSYYGRRRKELTWEEEAYPLFDGNKKKPLPGKGKLRMVPISSFLADGAKGEKKKKTLRRKDEGAVRFLVSPCRN